MAKENTNTEFVNPFSEGVNYKDFLGAIPKGVTVEGYCKEKLTEDQINWLVDDLKYYTNK